MEFPAPSSIGHADAANFGQNGLAECLEDGISTGYAGRQPDGLARREEMACQLTSAVLL
jgi:hypothetical protein